ncbi:MAG TPA: FAD-binding oxidoreductase, partial [Chroococcales cyanobacterium]
MKIPNLRQMLRNTKEHPGRNRLAQSVVEKVQPQVNPFSKNGRGLLAEVKGELSSVTPTLESEDKDLAAKLVDELSRVIEGEVHFETSYKAMYSTDASNYRQIPVGVVLVRSADDMIRTVEICRKYRVPVLSRGGGTSLCGQCCNAAVVMDTSKYFNRILELNYEEKYARVQPGVVLDTLRNRAEEKHLTFAPDPSTHNHCTLGGMIGNNSCGTHSVMGGVTADNVYELDVLLYDGTRMTVGRTSDEEYARIIAAGGRKAEIYKKLRNFVDKYADLIRAKFPKLKRRVSGYDLTALLPENGFDIARALVGSESTLVTVLEARVRLVPSPRKRSVVVLGYPDIFSAGDHVPEIMKFGPIALEGLDD